MCVALSSRLPLAERDLITFQDLEGENLMLAPKGDLNVIDELRDFLSASFPRIHIIETDRYYSTEVFNAEVAGAVLGTLEIWKDIRLALVTLLLQSDFRMPYGLISVADSIAIAAAFVEKLARFGHLGMELD